jgi:DNA-binding NarL/FixJ family response regulator
LIVEDHPVVARATLDLINVQIPGLHTFLARSAAEAEAAVATQPSRWHRVFLDLNIPGAIGLSTAAMVADAGLAGRCCIVTGSERENTMAQVQDMGFLGYILKNLPIDEFSDALRRVLQGERVFLAKTSTGPKRPRVTQRQAAILSEVSRGLGSKQIGGKLHIATGTVDNQLSAAMMALGVGTRSAAVVKALELGIIDLNRE